MRAREWTANRPRSFANYSLIPSCHARVTFTSRDDKLSLEYHDDITDARLSSTRKSAFVRRTHAGRVRHDRIVEVIKAKAKSARFTD